MRSTKLFSLGVAFAALFTVAGRAQAQTCSAAADCPQGYACIDLGVSVPTPACPPNVTCPTVDPMTTTVKVCQAKSCQTDADCGGDTVCHESTSSACSGGAAVAPCAPDTKCDTPPTTVTPPTCTTTTTRSCAFKWQLPCNAAADCGAGFDCHALESGACSGGAPSTDGRPTPAPVCTTMSTFPGYCQPKVTTCTADAECPASWKCVANASGSAASPPSGTATTTPAMAPVAPPEPTKVCLSPFGGIARDGTVAPGVPTSAGGGSNGAGSSSPVPGPSPPSSMTVQPVPAPTSGQAESGIAPLSTGSGCAVGGHADPGAGLGLLLVIGLALLRRRAVSSR
jgi:MYXO-CTERM domain-containing protein